MGAQGRKTRKPSSSRRRPRRAKGTSVAGRRDRVVAALGRCSPDERLVLALLLYERLTPPEAADALGVSQQRVQRMYESLLDDLHGAAKGPRARRGRRTRLPGDAPVLRRAA